MYKVCIDCNKRDGQHETPHATSTHKGRSARSAPGLCPLRRSCRLRGLEVDTEKSAKSSEPEAQNPTNEIHAHEAKSAKCSIHPEKDQTAAQSPSTSSTMEIYVHEANEKSISNSSDHSAYVTRDNKSPEPNHQVHPDSEPSIVGRAGSDFDQPCVHNTRIKDELDFKRDQNIRIDFPKSHDNRKWKELNAELTLGPSVKLLLGGVSPTRL